MGNCLVTKLKGVVNNNNLPILNAFCIEVNDSDNYNVMVLQPVESLTLKATDEGGVSLENGNFTKELTIQKNQWDVKVYLKKGYNYKVYIYSKYDIGRLLCGSTVELLNYGYDVEQCNYMSLDTLKLCNQPCYGELKKLAIETSFNVVEVSPFNVTCNLDTVEMPNNITDLQSRFNYISGSIRRFDNKLNVSVLDLLYCRNITGDVKEMLDAQVANGRTSGSIKIGAVDSGMTYNGSPITLTSQENHYYMRATFTESGYTITYEN